MLICNFFFFSFLLDREIVIVIDQQIYYVIYRASLLYFRIRILYRIIYTYISMSIYLLFLQIAQRLRVFNNKDAQININRSPNDYEVDTFMKIS